MSLRGLRTFGTWAFSVAITTVWNSLPDSLHDPAVESERFRRDLKTHLFAGHERIRGVTESRYTSRQLLYLLFASEQRNTSNMIEWSFTIITRARKQHIIITINLEIFPSLAVTLLFTGNMDEWFLCQLPCMTMSIVEWTQWLPGSVTMCHRSALICSNI